nr:oleate hydratase [Bifidobacterium bifidum]
MQHVGTLKNLSSLRFTKFNQYESLILPMVKFLKDHEVQFHQETTVDNIIVNRSGNDKLATKIEMRVAGEPQSIELTPNDLVFVTNGSITEST